MQSRARQPIIDISFGSVLAIIAAVSAGVWFSHLVESAHRVFSWIIACAIAAALLDLVVDWLDRRMHRSLAIVLTILVIALSVSYLTFGTLQELDFEVKRVQLVAPQAAHDIATSSRFRHVATTFNLENRVIIATEHLRAPSNGLAGKAVSSVGTYLFCAILTVLFLSWGPRVLSGLSRRLSPSQQRRVQDATRHAYDSSRRYVFLMILQSIGIGTATYIASAALSLPAAPVLALTVAFGSFIPNFGILLGAVPAILFATAFADPIALAFFLGILLLLQIISSVVIQPRIVAHSTLYVGPTLTIIALLIGFSVYGFGGAIYAVAITILAMAFLAALRTDDART